MSHTDENGESKKLRSAMSTDFGQIVLLAADNARIHVNPDGTRYRKVPIAPLLNGTYNAPPWVLILEHHGAIASAQEQPYRWLLTVGQLATLWRTYLRSTYKLASFAALFVHRDGKPYSTASLKTNPGADLSDELSDELEYAMLDLDNYRASLNLPDA